MTDAADTIKELWAGLREQQAKIEQLRGCLWDCRALLRGELTGLDQVAGALKWADDLLGDEQRGPSMAEEADMLDAFGSAVHGKP
jgi:hypothetical protein